MAGVLTTVKRNFIKVVIVFNAGSVSTIPYHAWYLELVADTINTLPAADKAITVNGVTFQPAPVVDVSPKAPVSEGKTSGDTDGKAGKRDGNTKRGKVAKPFEDDDEFIL